MKDYDKEFNAIQEQFLQHEIAENGFPDRKTAALVGIACLASIQTPTELTAKLDDSLEKGVSVTEIKETLYQAAPYIGYPKVREALAVVNEALLAKGLEPEEEGQGTVTAETRFEKGLAVQQQIFGRENINGMRAAAPEDVKHIQDCLSAHCFGDYYTRGTLDLKMRELVTFTAIISIGGCEPQAKAHAAANLSVGNTKADLIAVITTCLPYIGYPRTLNALSCVNEVCK